VTVVDSQDHFRTVVVRGRVVERRGHDEGANDHINTLARKYMGRDQYMLREGERRVLLRIKPTHVQEAGGAGGATWTARNPTES
jgi:hypothetical protein